MNFRQLKNDCRQNKNFDVLIEILEEVEINMNMISKSKECVLIECYSLMMYPADYGFIPETLALDGDPLDVLVLLTEPTFPGCVMEVKPIEFFHMADDKGPDEKVICVPVSDPIWNSLNDLSDMNPLNKGD
jgi:inorganic pyrophosphatase